MKWGPTAIIMVAVTVALLGYDLYALWGEPQTISRVAQGFLHRHPIIAAATGVIIGHWAWPNSAGTNTTKILILTAIGIGLAVAEFFDKPEVHPMWLLIPGIFAGHFLWGMRR